jgi:hypothetical protein
MLDKFFQKHYQKTLVLNGIRAIGGHVGGSYAGARGDTSFALPNFGAMYANLKGQDLPMPILGNFWRGNNTKGLANHTPLVAIDKLRALQSGNHFHNGEQNFDAGIYDEINDFVHEELNQRIYTEDNAAHEAAMEILKGARADQSQISNVTSYLPTSLSSGFKGHMERIGAAFASGSSVFASAYTGNFDHHGGLDGSFGGTMGNFLGGVDHLWSELERHGIADKTTVFLFSDMGRTPWYNNGGGKDHWSTASYLLMGNGVKGNRVIGHSSDKLQAQKLNPETLEVDEEKGVYLQPAHVHKAMRRISGIEDSFLDYAYKLDVDYLDILS